MSKRSLETAALRYLQRFPCSTDHLRQVLRRRVQRAEVPPPEDAWPRWIDEVIATMTEAGLLNDAAYARALAASLHRKGRPLRSIAAKLREKRVPVPLVRECLEGMQEDVPDADVDAAWVFAAKKRLGPYSRSPEERRARRPRDLAAFARAGFSFSVARIVVDAPTPRE
ncbi:MAG: RecX family transcriptional regulator [Myxococcota bacterium]